MKLLTSSNGDGRSSSSLLEVESGLLQAPLPGCAGWESEAAISRTVLKSVCRHCDPSLSELERGGGSVIILYAKHFETSLAPIYVFKRSIFLHLYLCPVHGKTSLCSSSRYQKRLRVSATSLSLISFFLLFKEGQSYSPPPILSVSLINNMSCPLHTNSLVREKKGAQKLVHGDT